MPAVGRVSGGKPMKNGITQFSVLIVSGTQRDAAYIADMLMGGAFRPISSAQSGGEARRLFLQNSYDLVIINTPLPDEFGYALAEHITEQSAAGVLLIVKSELFEEASARAEACGVLTLRRPVSRPLFYQAVRMLAAVQNRWRRMDGENRKLREKMEEIRIVARAKCILVEYLRMSEQQAHRYIEKQAMDMRTSKRNIAENILKTYN